MIASYRKLHFDLQQPFDISTPLHDGEPQINCYSAPLFRTEPVRAGNFIGSTKEGGLLNYKNVFLNPHGNGTHTECVAHISDLPITIHESLQRFHFLAQLISITPQREGNNACITKEQVEEKLKEIPEALIIRTLPNTKEKLSKNYNRTNPPYLHADAAQWICEKNMLHILIDLPSLDPEVDGGKLLAHRAFFRYPENPRTEATITELIYVPDSVPDGIYLLNLQIVSFQLDVSPSKPVLYPIKN